MEEVTSTNTNLSVTGPKHVALGTIKIFVYDSNGSKVTATALLDEGSDTTLIRSDLAKRLNIAGENCSLHLQGVTGVKSKLESQKVELQIQTVNGIATLNGSTVPKVCEAVPVINWKQLKTRWPYLSKLPIKESGGKIDILLGLNHADLMLAKDQRSGDVGEPCAIKTALGWIVRGVIFNKYSNSVGRVNLTVQDNVELENIFKNFIKTENFGTENSDVSKLPPDDQRALDIVKQGTRKLL